MPCPTTASATCSASPPGARATGRRSAAWSTAARRASRCPRPTSSPGWIAAAPASRASPRSGRSRTRCASCPACSTGLTTGTPIAMQIDNVDQRSRDYSAIAAQFRPGHADLTYELKYGIRDYRGGGRSSARETAMRVAAGGVARKVLGDGVRIRGALVQIGPHRIDRARWDWDAVDDNPFFCPDPATATLWEALSVRGAQGRLVGRRGDRGGGRGRPARPGRADLRQARRRDRRGADVDQRGEGRRDRRGLRRRGTVRRGQRRRDAHAATGWWRSPPTMPAASWAASPPASPSSHGSR